MTRVASNQICVITRHGLRFGEVRRIVWRGLGGGLWPCLACGRACCDVWRVVFFNFDVNVSQQSQYSEKTPTTVGCIRICTHVFVKLCGRHEEEALKPSMWNLNEFEQAYDRKKRWFQNMSKLVKPSGGGREGQSLAAPRRPPALSGVHSSDHPFTDPNPAEKLQHKLSGLCFKQFLIEIRRPPPLLLTMVYSNPPKLIFATLVRVMMQNPAENI